MAEGRQVIALHGSGAVADAVGARLALDYEVTREAEAGVELLIACQDLDDRHERATIQRACEARSLSWLPVHPRWGSLVIGPTRNPGIPGCAHCFDLRHERARPTRSALPPPPDLLTHLALSASATLVASEVGRLLTGKSAPRTLGAVIDLDLGTLEARRRGFLPEPPCPRCGTLPEDSADAAGITLPAQSAIDRLREPANDHDLLLAAYVDNECGLINELRVEESHGLAAAEAFVSTGNRPLSGYGLDGDRRRSAAVAVLEGVERYAGLEPGGKRTTVRGAYRDLSADALNPEDLCLYPDDRYDLPGFTCRPFEEDADYNWVWGYSFARERPILVPESAAYYGAVRDRPFLQNCSSGCAVGSSLPEAILHGVLEVAERDAFLLGWYAKVPGTRIDVSKDRTAALAVCDLEARFGCRVLLNDMMVDHGIPVTWALAIFSAPGFPTTVSAAAAHLDPARATRKAINELRLLIPGCIERHREESWRIPLLISRPSHVRHVTDHALLYSSPQTFHRFDFLLSNSLERTSVSRVEPCDGVRGVIERFLGLGMDVIAVDQTRPELAAANLFCVKIIIPGTISMTFGHDYRHLDGIRRLGSLPQALGFRAAAKITHDPHPFV